MKNREQIRNFSIIAHIDHGKSTLADRLLEQCKAVSQREMEEQLLDNMDLERERGITIKARAVRMEYEADDGKTYEMNLIDSPAMWTSTMRYPARWLRARVRCWSWMRRRALRRRRWATPIWRSTQGLRSCRLSQDRPACSRRAACQKGDRGYHRHSGEDSPEISAKMNLNIHAVLERIVSDIPAPTGDPDAPLRALIFDSSMTPIRAYRLYALDGRHDPSGHEGQNDGDRAVFQCSNVVICCHLACPRSRSCVQVRLVTSPRPSRPCPIPGRRHGYRGRPPDGGSPAGLSSRAADGVLWYLHRGWFQIPRSA